MDTAVSISCWGLRVFSWRSRNPCISWEVCCWSQDRCELELHYTRAAAYSLQAEVSSLHPGSEGFLPGLVVDHLWHPAEARWEIREPVQSLGELENSPYQGEAGWVVSWSVQHRGPQPFLEHVFSIIHLGFQVGIVFFKSVHAFNQVLDVVLVWALSLFQFSHLFPKCSRWSLNIIQADLNYVRISKKNLETDC